MLLTAFGVVLTLYGFIEVAEEMGEGGMQHFDEWLLRRLRREGDPAMPIGPSWLAQMRVYVIGVSLVLTFLVGTTRLYLGVHHPSDVLAGWSGGLAWALLCWLVARYLQYRGTVETPGSHGAP